MPRNAQTSTHRRLPCANWCETRLVTIIFPVPLRHRLDYETIQKRNGIRWTFQSQQDNLDFADDLPLLSHTQQQMQEKTNIVAKHSAHLGLNIHKGKTNIPKVNSTSTVSVTMGVEAIEHGRPRLCLYGTNTIDFLMLRRSIRPIGWLVLYELFCWFEFLSARSTIS